MICINAEGYYLTQDGHYEKLADFCDEVQVINDARKIAWYPKRIFIL